MRAWAKATARTPSTLPSTAPGIENARVAHRLGLHLLDTGVSYVGLCSVQGGDPGKSLLPGYA
jgi:hypothetical protein